MSSADENLITAVEVMRRIRSRLGMDQETPPGFGGGALDSSGARSLPRVPRLRPLLDIKQSYALGELLGCDDIDFVSNAYNALLRRAPDESAMNFVNALRDGSLTKVEVLGHLRFSQEGMRYEVHVDGLLVPYKLRMWRRKRYVGPFLRWLVSIGQIGRLFDRQNAHMAIASAEIQSCREVVNNLAGQVEGLLSSIEAAILQFPRMPTVNQLRIEIDEHFERILLHEAHAEKIEGWLKGEFKNREDLRARLDSYGDRLTEIECRAETSWAQLNELASEQSAREERVVGSVSSFEDRLNNITESCENLRSEVGLNGNRILQLEVNAGESSERRRPGFDQGSQRESSLDALYAAFEDDFRGPRELIRQRVAPYLDFVEATSAGLAGTPIVDLGCGRGEWLELLRERGYIARGVEINKVFIDVCRGRGLEVINEDAITALRALDSNSVGMVSIMHLAEHLPFVDLIALVDESLRVLVPGGGLIVETPNPENALVSRCAFYMDPTHRNPLPPEMLRWMVKARGFMFVEIERLFVGRQIEAAKYLEEDIPGALAVNQLLTPLHASLDYAVLARKQRSA